MNICDRLRSLTKLEFFQRQLDQRNPQIFRVATVDVRNYGLAVELPDALITGLVPSRR
jgi:hypothetical protein